MTGWDGRPADDDFTPWDPDAAADPVDGNRASTNDRSGDISGETAVSDLTVTVDPATAASEPASPAGTAATEPDTSGSDAPAVFIDSSAIVALVDQDDSSHEAAVAAYRELVGTGYRLFTSNYVIAETYDLLRTGVGHAVARQWLRDSTLAVYHADEQDERRARRIMLRGRGASGMTFTDAISLVVMERFGVADAFAVDPNFLSGND
ncbi:MAG TPA: PIN domain-containing protein [Thermomicrobiales bacterium]|jgi:predicted nucleic acid-binding protein|nr:PIN domain-containing protein [Thermomicrobiales bacterium]